MVKWLKKYSFNGSKALALAFAVATTSGDGTGQIFAQEAILGAPADVGDAVAEIEHLPRLNLDNPLRLNFSGSWEKDFQRSDKWEDELSRMMTIRQERSAIQSTGGTGVLGPSVSIGNINLNSSRARGSSIVDLARLTEYVSRQTTMEIYQDRNEVRIERRGEADLVCTLAEGPTETFSSDHGAEMCGWDRQQLVFRTALPGDLDIMHRFSVSSNTKVLRMVVSISSRDSAPFNLIQAFNRYDASSGPFNCIQTITRGKVCSQTTILE